MKSKLPKEVKSRLTESWRTSLIGVVLMSASVFSVFHSGATWADAAIPLTLGLGFLFSKDNWINKAIK
jgi:hypothetical protein